MKYIPMFSFKSLIVLAFMFRFMTYFDLLFVYNMKKESNYFATGYLVVPAHFVKRLFCIELSWYPPQKLTDHKYMLYFWTFNSIPLTYIYTFIYKLIPVPHSVD